MDQVARNVSTIAASLSLALSIGASAAAQNHGLVGRYTTAGAPDSTFSDDGFVVSEGTANVQGHGVVVNGASPGKITTVGAIASAGAPWSQILGRYNDNGTPDTTFGWLGAATADYPGSTSEIVRAVTVQAGTTSKLVVAVQANDTVQRGWLVERFNANGALDGTFGNGGFKLATFLDADGAEPVAIANAGLGRIAVAGKVFSPANQDFGIARYLSNGDLDPNFSGDGLQRVHFSQLDNAGGMAVHGTSPHTNKIVVAGSTFVGSESQMMAVRLTEGGGLDSTFGNGDGIVTVDFPGPITSGAFAVAIAPGSDKIVLAGAVRDPVTTFFTFAVVRLKADGSFDDTFGGGDGMVTTPLSASPHSAIARAVSVMSDGRIVIAGTAQMGEPSEQVAVVRYKANGDLDGTFDQDGIRLTSFLPDAGIVQAMTLNGANKPVVVGWTVDH